MPSSSRFPAPPARRFAACLVPGLRWLLAWAFALAVLALSAPAQAYTWMIKHGYGSCGTCHADPTGGELLTDYGRSQGELIVRMVYGKDELSAQASESSGSGGAAFDDAAFDDFDAIGVPEPGGEQGGAAGSVPAPNGNDSEATGEVKTGAQPEALASAPEAEQEIPDTAFLWGLYQPPSWLLLGGSYRHLSVIKSGSDFETFPMQMDLYAEVRPGRLRLNGSLGLSRVEVGSPHARAAQLTTNQGKEWNLLSRTHWVGYEVGSGLLARAGRLNLPFGVRVPEHVLWVREATVTDRESDQQHGAALSYAGSAVRAELMGVLGNYQLGPDKYRERGYSLFGEYFLNERAAVGVSSLITRADADRFTLRDAPTLRHAHGVLARVAPISPLVVLAEFDVLKKTASGVGYVGFVQLDYELVQGLHLIATGELLDGGEREGGVPVRGAGEPRFGGWLSVDWFFYRQFELRLDVQARQDTAVTFLPQLHVYL